MNALSVQVALMQLQTVLGSQLAQEAERSNGATDGANEMREIADSVNDLSTAVLSASSSLFVSTGSSAERDASPSRKGGEQLFWELSSKWAAAWRCDLHPAWDRSYSWLALNGRPSGGLRQVPYFARAVLFPFGKIAWTSLICVAHARCSSRTWAKVPD